MCFRTFTLGKALLLLVIIGLSALANAQTETLLYTFSEQTTFWPLGAFIEDSSGNLYGVTKGGGTYGAGTVYEFTPSTKTFTILYSFVPWGNTGYVPSSDLIEDSAGNFYGTTLYSANGTCNCGVVYKLSPPATQGGAWTETPLYNFTNSPTDGRLPNTSLAMNKKGYIFGVTQYGGAWDSGTIFELVPQTGGTYTESILYSFGDLGDASFPNGPITLDSTGNLYGVTMNGGAFDGGAVYKLSSGGKGKLVETLLYSFNAATNVGANPSGSLLWDSKGNLYGVTNAGGNADGYGVVYELTPGTSGWTETILYTLVKSSGTNPVGGLVWSNSSQNLLYGTTSSLNSNTTGDGTVFQLAAPTVSGGAWTYTVLYDFTYNTTGGFPTGRVTVDPSGTLYGSAMNGGIEGCDLYCGVLWQITNP